eukprot:Em0018g928a
MQYSQDSDDGMSVVELVKDTHRIVQKLDGTEEIVAIDAKTAMLKCLQRCAAGTFCLLGFSCCLLRTCSPNSASKSAANMQPPQLSYVDEALAAWSQGCQEQPPTDAAAHHQKTWDTIRVSSIADTDSSNPMNRARFLAASCKESGAWLNALPVTSLGLCMDNATMRISMGLPLCQSHTCQHCGAEVSQFATHGLSCRKSAGRHHCHSAMNEIIHRALVSAHVPSRLEPSGLYCSDGKRPDGVSIVPWKCGQLLVWDATCPDTFAPSYSTIAAHQVGAVAQQAEDRKMQKYKHLDSCYFFTPVAIETSGVFGPKTTEFLKELGHRLRQVSGEANSFAYLAQRLSVAIQRGNAASVLGTIKMDSEEEEFLV